MRREKRKRIKRQSDKILGILFIACLFIIMILNLMTKDKKISEEENRTLTERPRCTWDSVLGGIYMQQYESYISDQFAGRNLGAGLAPLWKESVEAGKKTAFSWKKEAVDGRDRPA